MSYYRPKFEKQEIGASPAEFLSGPTATTCPGRIGRVWIVLICFGVQGTVSGKPR